MHEMALAASVRDIVEEAARRHDARRVRGVQLEIGALSHVEPDALRFCFDATMRGSLAEGATLSILATPGEAWCMPCGATVPLARVGDPCPHCGGHQLVVSRGDAMRVVTIDIQ